MLDDGRASARTSSTGQGVHEARPVALVPVGLVAPTRGSDSGATRETAPVATTAASFKVLLMQDNVDTLDLVERVLARRPGTEVVPAMEGRSGVDLAREQLPDLILLDLELAPVGGTTVLDLLAEDPATARIPVAAVGTDVPTQVVRQLLGRGVVGYLAKPIDVRGLLSIVDAVRAARGA